MGVLERSATPAGTTGRSCAEQGPIIVDKKGRDGGVEEEGRLLAEADRFFEEGMDAYMREDPEVNVFFAATPGASVSHAAEKQSKDREKRRANCSSALRSSSHTRMSGSTALEEKCKFGEG